MAVRAECRGRGIGRRLVSAAIEAARREDARTLVVATAAADVGNLRFYQRCGFRMRSVERDVFTAAAGYPAGTMIDGIELRDRVWLDMELGPPRATLAVSRETRPEGTRHSVQRAHAVRRGGALSGPARGAS